MAFVSSNWEQQDLSEYSQFLCQDLNRPPIEYYHDLGGVSD
jgi:hypothetical protein